MSPIQPVIRHMLLCDNVRPSGSRKVNIIGLMNTIVTDPEATFPLPYPQLCVYIQFSGARGEASVQARICTDAENDVIYETNEHTFVLDNHPLAVSSFLFRIRDCSFPGRGPYLVELVWNREVVKQQSLFLR